MKKIILFLAVLLGIANPVNENAKADLHAWTHNIAETIKIAYVYQDDAWDIEIPSRYDYRENGRQGIIKDQSDIKTCWSMASTSAAETSVRPQSSAVFSADHLLHNNPYGSDTENGGNYCMSMAYFLSWKGPVSETDDPYGDDYSPEGLESIFHVQDVCMLDKSDYTRLWELDPDEDADEIAQGINDMRTDIKKLIYRYGAIETGIHFDMDAFSLESDHYNYETNAYYYSGDEPENHEVIIIGWDDDYPAENFLITPEGNGAYICQNSWGRLFGEDGVFYVSYYDPSICNICVCYSKVESADNYDNIYQYDECGWTGQLGYGDETAYFANVFTAENNEDVVAAGFFTMGKDSEYSVFFIPEFSDVSDLETKEPIACGKISHRGFHTIPFNIPEKVYAGERFAVIVKIETGNCNSPAAVEYGENSYGIPLEINGNGYISYNGETWENTETNHNSDVCLKVYTKN